MVNLTPLPGGKISGTGFGNGGAGRLSQEAGGYAGVVGVSACAPPMKGVSASFLSGGKGYGRTSLRARNQHHYPLSPSGLTSNTWRRRCLSAGGEGVMLAPAGASPPIVLL